MEDTELLCEVAHLYYEQQLTQSQISAKVHTSRSTVSRLLQEARDRGIVEIIIHYPRGRSPEIEQEMIARFGLKEVRILDSHAMKDEDITKGVYQLAARYIQSILKENILLGTSWGRTVYNTIQRLQITQKIPLKVVQLFGAANLPNRMTDGPDLVRQLANLLGGECYFIHAPLFVGNPKAKEALLQDHHIKQALTLAHKVDIALTGIGSLSEDSNDRRSSSSYLTADDVRKLKNQGAIGHICAQHYDIHGNIVDTDIHKGLIGVSLPALHHIKQVVGIAYGEEKVLPLLGALRGRYINTLITDTATANRVLEMHAII